MLKRGYRRIQAFLLPLTGGVKTANIYEIVSGLKRADLILHDWDRDYGAGSMWDLISACLIARHRQPKLVFEIGTGHGRSTHHVALNAPDTRIFTLDISTAEHTGSIFRGQSTSQQITQLVGNSTNYDWTPYLSKTDLVIVDGDHAYDGVKNDTEVAFKLVAPGGVILWDDFAPGWPGVIKALKQHPKAKSFRKIAGSKWVYYFNDEKT